MGTFLLLLLAAWAGSIFGVSSLGASIDYGSPALTFYAGFLFALSAASLVIVPFWTFRSIVEERTETTLELLQITALSPVEIVHGKTLSAMVQVLVYYCALAPFIAFTALLPGFDVVHVAFSLIMLLITALCFSMIALAIGAQARKATSQAFGSLVVIALAFGGMMGFFSFMTAAGENIRFDDGDTWWGLALVVYLGLSSGYLCQQGAVAQLTFESDNRSTAHPGGGNRAVACLLDRIAGLPLHARPAADIDRGVGRHFDGKRDLHHHDGAVFRERTRFPVAGVSRGLPRSRTQGGLGPLSAGRGAACSLPSCHWRRWAFLRRSCSRS